MKQSGNKSPSFNLVTTGILTLGALLQPAFMPLAHAQDYQQFDAAAQQAPAGYQYGDQQAPPAASYSQQQLDQLVAPIALYPDQLLGQILMASTYPLEIVEAYRWQQANVGLTGDQLADALEQQPWDPSVKAMTAFPQVLATLNNSIEWTEQLGDAFLAQQAGVMDSVQRLRHEAEVAGHLQSTPQQTVETEGPEILIQPANPEYVYVPVYNPQVIYGAWAYPDYQPYGFNGYANYGAVIGFGVGVAVLASYWGWHHWDWHDHRMLIDNSRFARINNGRPPAHSGVWQFNPDHRHGVPFHGTTQLARGSGPNRGAFHANAAPVPNNPAHNNFRGYDNVRPASAQPGSFNRNPGFTGDLRSTNRQSLQQRTFQQPQAQHLAPQPHVMNNQPVFSPQAHATAPAPMQPHVSAAHNSPMFESFARGPDVRAQAARGAASRASTPAVAHAPVQHSAPQGGFHGGAPNRGGGEHPGGDHGR